MTTLPYLCAGRPLEDTDLAEAAASLGVDIATVWCVLSVETHGCGFFADRRPTILYERHVFHRLTGGKFDDGSISSAQPGGYLGGTAEYARLGKAAALAQDAALKSASWGLGQIMGENFAVAGYPNVEAMVEAMCGSEAAHLQAFVGFVKGNRLDVALRKKDWAAFARGYNGPNYVANHYDDRLAMFYNSFQQPANFPDLQVRTAQVHLRTLGYDPRSIDGKLTPATLTALHNFQHAQGSTLTAEINAEVIAALTAAVPSPDQLRLG